MKYEDLVLVVNAGMNDTANNFYIENQGRSFFVKYISKIHFKIDVSACFRLCHDIQRSLASTQ